MVAEAELESVLGREGMGKHEEEIAGQDKAAGESVETEIAAEMRYCKRTMTI